MPALNPSPSPPRGRRAHRKVVTRQDLLAAGRRLFGDRGLYESRIEDLTSYAGVAKGTLYGYFRNKAALIEAVVAAGFGDLLAHVRLRAEGARTRADLVGRIVESHLSYFEDNPDVMRILHQVRGLLKFRRPESAPLRRLLVDYLGGLGRLISSGRRGRSRADLATAAVLFGAVSGIASTRASLASGDSKPLESRATVRAVLALVERFETSSPAPRTKPSRRSAPSTRPGARPGRPRRRPPARAR